MASVELTGGYLPVYVDPADGVSIAITVPSGYTSGTWTADVYRDRRQSSALATFTVSGPTSQVLTLTLDDADVDDLCPAGTSKFVGWWELVRTSADVPRTWLRGPFVIDPEHRNTEGYTAATVTINSGAVTVTAASPTIGEIASVIHDDAMRLVKVTYKTNAVSGVASDGWHLHDDTAPTFTGRTWPVMWEGTSAQIPAQGAGGSAFQTGDVAVVRATTL